MYFTEKSEELIYFFKEQNNKSDITGAKFHDIKLECLVSNEDVGKNLDQIVTIYFINQFHKKLGLS
ncbi:hypothetical protein [Francisella frigiditurris]|nr:hypothetical protein [Francisella frigiditurris]